MWDFNLTIAAIAFVCILVYLYIEHMSKFNYWKDRNIAYMKPEPIFGNARKFITNLGSVEDSIKMYNAFPDEKMLGFFIATYPNLLIRDPDLIKLVLIKDFNYFTDRFSGITFDYEILVDSIFFQEGEKWRVGRHKLTPAFTTNKLKNMTYLIVEKGEEFRKYIAATVADVEATECFELVAKFTTDVIGSCGFGIAMHSMLDEDATFRSAGRHVFKWTVLKSFIFGAKYIFPNFSNFFRIRLVPSQMDDFFLTTIKEVVAERKVSKKKRHDFIDLLLEMKENENVDNLTVDDRFMTSQAFLFFLAGFETTSSLLSCLLHEIAHYPEIQTKLRNEIDLVLGENDGEMTYDVITKMPYLEMVLREGMRMYPVSQILTRTCCTPYIVPGTNLLVEKGVRVFIPIYFIHRDPKYYPEPEKFIPERFTAEAQRDRHPMVYLPFGEGPRQCIGRRLANLQSKVALISILRDYVVESCYKSQRILTLITGITTSSKNGVWLKFSKRK